MKPEIFMDDFERTLYGDNLYSIIGRALTISSRFEATCKSFNALIHVKSESINLEPEEEIQKKVDKMHKLPLAKHICEITGDFKCLFKILDEARKARNEIAHEITLDLDQCIDSIPKDAIMYLKSRLQELIEIIAEADKIISNLISKLTNDPLPNSDFLKAYSNRIKHWVMDVD